MKPGDIVMLTQPELDQDAKSLHNQKGKLFVVKRITGRLVSIKGFNWLGLFAYCFTLIEEKQ